MNVNDPTTEHTVFKNKSYLAKGYHPTLEEVQHRETEKTQLLRYLSSALQGTIPDNIILFGKTGTGKTMLVELTTENIRERGRGQGVEIKICYINCESLPTDAIILRTLATTMKDGTDMTNIKCMNSCGAYFTVFSRTIDKFQGVPVIIFDEVDKLKNPDLLNQFSRIKENHFANKNVCIIGITNNLNFISNLDPRTKSSLCQREIIFHPYDALSIADILRRRAEQAFTSMDVMSEGVIELCAAYSAQDSGDARKAIELLKMSGDIADSDGSPIITEAHVKTAKLRRETDTVTEVIKYLPVQSKAVLASCACGVLNGNTEPVTGEVYNIYKSISKTIRLEIITQRRLTDLLSELDMLGILEARIVSKGRYGRTKTVTLIVDANAVWELLCKDELLIGLHEAGEHLKQVFQHEKKLLIQNRLGAP